MTRKPHWISLPVSVAGVLVAAVGPAVGQLPGVDAPVDPGPMVAFDVRAAEGETSDDRSNYVANATATCPTPAVYTEPYEVTFEASVTPELATTSVSPGRHAFEYGHSECVLAQAERGAEVLLALRFHDDAPAFTGTQVSLNAAGRSGTLGSSSWTVEVPFFGGIIAEVEEQYREPEPGRVRLVMTITNDANGPIAVATAFERQPGLGNVTLPPVVEVPWGERAATTVTLDYTFERAGRDVFMIELTPSAAERPDETLHRALLRVTVDTHKGTIEAEQIGGERAMPLPSIAVLLLSVAALAIAGRPGRFGKP